MNNVRAIIGPHAGYSYSGETAGYAYCALKPKSIKRVFVLGPSHRMYTPKCHVTTASSYKTPLGNVTIDSKVCAELLESGHFEPMKRSADEDEHSIEMHVPYIASVMRGHSYTLVPIMVGSLDITSEKLYGRLLAKYFDDPENFFVISSDFCHWGRRFSYSWHDDDIGPIHRSIEWLDREAIRHIEECSSEGFSNYLKKYRNTICGRHPISVLLRMIEGSKSKHKISFTHYAQSDRCISISDSSVSYASAVVLKLSAARDQSEDDSTSAP